MLFFSLCLVLLWLVHQNSCGSTEFVALGIMPMQVRTHLKLCFLRQVMLLLSDAATASHVMCQYVVCHLYVQVACSTIGYMVATCNLPI